MRGKWVRIRDKVARRTRGEGSSKAAVSDDSISLS